MKVAFVAGGAAPDLPIILAFAGCTMLSGFDMTETMASFRAAYDAGGMVTAAHNVLHAPPSLALLFLATLALRGALATVLQTFLAGCALHSLIDIYTHVNDGPLMLWPFDWSKRFDAPLSHWDPQHFGYAFAILEASILLLFVAARLWGRAARRAERDALEPVRTS